jgi:hypothetical protein
MESFKCTPPVLAGDAASVAETRGCMDSFSGGGLRGVGSLLEVLSFGCPAVVAAVVCLSAYIVAAGFYYQSVLGPALERDLGFTGGAAYLSVGRRLHSAVALTVVAPGGVFDRAGFRAGDVLPGVSHTDLFRLLHRHRGQVAELSVMGGGDGPPFGERPARVILFEVPRRGV